LLDFLPKSDAVMLMSPGAANGDEVTVGAGLEAAPLQ
jgi:hypothetical protein